MTKYFKITRKDNNIEYAIKYDKTNEFFLFGSGFGIIEFDALSVEEIKEIPTKMSKGLAYFDELDENCFEAYTDLNKRWNGWAMPYIHSKEVEKLIKMMCEEGGMQETKMSIKNGVIDILQTYEGEIEYEDKIEPTIIDNEPYYFFGHLGLCFDFQPLN
jgi:hypothetical protein